MNDATPAGFNGLEIAIVGMVGRFPGARDLEQFWRNLRDGIESVSFFSDSELAASGVLPELLANPRYVRAQAALRDVESFDAGFFGYSPREAEILDPQHRLFLESAWEALEDAGYQPEGFRGAIGVYAGVGMSQYFLNNLHADADLLRAMGSFHVGIGNDKDYLSTRVSYKLNLAGPSLTVQTACSTSLVAVHLACQGLLSGECDVALAGGVSIALPQGVGYLHTEGGILSPDGHCRPFDASAQGCVGGSGVGIVVLKRLDNALADGDSVRAVIKGSAVNNDGSAKVGYTAPGLNGQAKVIRRAQRMAEVAPESISYVEAHGTATALGDPIEIAALNRVFGARAAHGHRCAVGSVKGNIGHLDAAAGVVGLIKTVLSLERRQLPPSLHFESPNPRIDFASGPFYVNAALADWPQGTEGPRRAGVSSFGIGGTNAHVVLEEAPIPETVPSARPGHLFLLSARSAAALDGASVNLASFLSRHPEVDPADVAYTLQVGRKAFDHRRIVVASGTGELADLLTSPLAGKVFTSEKRSGARPVLFLFPGQGAQHPGMGADLYKHEPIFRSELDRCAELLSPVLGLDLRQVLFPTPGRSRDAEELTETYLAQPAIFAVEYALARLWMGWGVEPRAMIGHSIGEYVAACLAGVFTLEDALALVAARGRLMQGLPRGAMLAVPLGEKDLAPLLDGDLSLAAVNSPGVCLVAGPAAAVAALHERLLTRGLECRRLHTSHAFHSAMMDPILDPFRHEVEKIALQAPRIPYLSNLTGEWITEAEATDPSYWASHLRGVVRFAQGLEKLLPDPAGVLLEVGPGRVLGTLARRHPDCASEQLVLSSLPHPQIQAPEWSSLLAAAGQLWLAGVPLDGARLHAAERRRRVPLPTYPFERQRYWVSAGGSSAASQAQPSVGKRQDVAEWFYVPLWRQALPALPEPTPSAVEGDWLVLADDRLGGRLGEQLKRRGASVVSVEPGNGFLRLAPDRYRIDPRRREDYARLLRELKASARQIGRMVHLWTVAAEVEGERALDLGFFSLLYLAQAVGEQSLALGGGKPLRLDVVSCGVQRVGGAETLVPERATVLGACRVIPREYPGFSCRCIDIELPPTDGMERDLLCEQLLAELLREEVEPVVAYRGVHRWLQVFEPVRLPATVPSRLRDRGVYLITGGLGGVGLELAGYLAETVRGRLVLVGRSAFPDRRDWPQWLAEHGDADEVSGKIRRLLSFEAQGSEVLVVSADVADRDQMERILAAARARFGPLQGVIHAAGTPPTGVMQLKTRDSAAAILAPKVSGTRVLAELLKDAELDFLVLCSSLSSVLGEPGRADYAAANAFLDAFALGVEGRGLPLTVAIGWDGWSDVGMSARRTPETEADRSALAESMTSAEGVETFRRVLASGLAQVLVSTRDFAARLAESQAATADSSLAVFAAAREERPSYPRPLLGVPYAAPATDAEGILVRIWQELLGVDPVGVDDNFFELGGDSLIGLQLVARASRAGLSFPAGQLFEHPTVRELAGRAGTVRMEAIELGAERGPVPLTPIQAWFFERDLPDPHHWNQAQLLEIRQALDVAALSGAVADLVRHHDALRLRFTLGADGWQQAAAEEDATPLSWLDLSGLPDERRSSSMATAAGDLQASLDLARGPLFRVALFDLGADRSGRLLLLAHHLTIDVTSWQIVLADLHSFYEQRSRGESPRLAEPTTAFTRWAKGLARHIRSGKLDDEARYWLAQDRSRKTPPLPLDFPAGLNTEGSARTISVALDAETTRELLREVPARHSAQVNDLLLTALSRAFGSWTGSPVLHVELEGHGREALFEGVDLSRTIGWFTSIYPVRLDLTGVDGRLASLARVQAELRGLPSRGMSYGLLRYLGGDGEIAARLQAAPRAEVLFAYLGEIDQGQRQESPFRLANETPGPIAAPGSPRGHLLNVNALVLSGRLIQNWTYSGNLHCQETLEALAETALAELRTLIEECLGPQEGRPTPADFADAELSQEELDDLLATYAEPSIAEDPR